MIVNVTHDDVGNSYEDDLKMVRLENGPTQKWSRQYLSLIIAIKTQILYRMTRAS